MKPKLRDDAYTDLGYLLKEAVINAMQSQRHPFKNCLNCRHFNEKTELCYIYKQRPPARVIAFGCPTHKDNEEIPF